LDYIGEYIMKYDIVPEFIMPFGKYAGATLEDISIDDAGYVVWFIGNNNCRIVDEDFLRLVAERQSNELIYAECTAPNQ
jgi:hypothetical protein